MAFRKKTLGLIERLTITASSGGNLALANNSRTFQQITGTLGHTVTLPQANAAAPNECPQGLRFTVLNRSTAAIDVNYFGGALAKQLGANSQATFRLISNGSSAGTWDVTNEASGGGGESLTDEEKLAALSALANSLYEDDETKATRLQITPDEIGGNFWTSKAPINFLKTWAAVFKLNGFAYNVGGCASGVDQDTSERYNDDADYWLTRDTLNTGRDSSSAFVVEGKGYTTAGLTGGSSVTSNVHEEYDDATNIWTTKTVYPLSLYGPACFSLDGLGYVVGGLTLGPPTFQTAVYAYLPGTNAWYNRSPLSTASGRSGGSDGLYKNRGYVFGSGTTSGRVEKYDQILNSWSNVASMSIRHAYPAIFVMNGTVTIAGGEDNSGTFVNTTETYLDEADVWKTNPSPTATAGDMNGCSLNGNGYKIGGGQGSGTHISNVEKYVNTSLFALPVIRKLSTSPQSLFGSVAINALTHSVAARVRTDGDNWKYFEANSDSILKLDESLSKKLLESGQLYVVGGDSANGASVYNLVDFYDKVQNAWISRQAFTTGKTFGQNFKANGYAHIAGGNTTGGTQATNDRYNETLNAWDTKAVLPVGKATGCGYNLNGYGYAVAGGNGGLLLTNYRYDADADSWSTRTAITSVTALAAGMDILGRAYVMNGSSTGSFGNNQNLNQQYNDFLDAWTAKTGSTNGRSGPGGFAINGFGFISGGFYSGTFANTTTERYDPALNTWSNMAAISAGRTCAGGSTYDNAGWIYGGQVGTTPFATVDRYNEGANTFTAMASLGTARTGSGGQFTPGVYRNYQMQIGLPTYLAAVGSGQWITKSNAVYAAGQSCVNFTIGDSVYNAFGLDGSGGSGRTNRMQRFDRSINSWTQDTPGIVADGDVGGGASSATLYGRGFMSGINGTAGVLTGQSFLYDQPLRAWISIATGPGSGQGNVCPVLNGFGYSISGGPGVPAQQTATNRYSPATNAWTNGISVLNNRHYYGSAGVMNGFINLAGDSAPNANNEQFNDASLVWTTKTAATSSFQSAATFVIGDGWHLAGPSGFHYVYKDSLNLWSTKTSYPLSAEGANFGTVAGNGIVSGGYTGSYSVSTYEWASAIKNVVVGAGLRIV